METSALNHRTAALRGPTPLLRLQSDERLVALTRRGNQSAYETLVARYQSRLFAFCRHMLRSREDAEDVVQEVFAAAFNALMADTRPINTRPWLYRIARNRCLNHLRRTQSIGVDSMDIHFADNGTTTADRVHQREEFRDLLTDVGGLAETQRTALLLREIDALSYDQIAEAMETTVPAVKSLLVRARVTLAEASEARRLTCEEVREELGEVAEGLKRRSAPVRRHTNDCERCAAFEKDLRKTNKALAAIFPVGPLLLLKKYLVAHGASQAAAGSATAGAGAAAATGGASGAVGAGVGVIVTKTTAGLAAAALITAGAAEVDHVRSAPLHHRAAVTARHTPAAAAVPTPRVVALTPQPVHESKVLAKPAENVAAAHAAAADAVAKPDPVATTVADAVTTPTDAPVQTATDTTILPPQGDEQAPSGGVMAPSEQPTATTPASSTPAPPTTTTTAPPAQATAQPGAIVNVPPILPAPQAP